jgi:hypothetical protein
VYGSLAALPRLVSGAILFVFILILFTAGADAQTGASLNNPLNREFSTVPGFIAGALRVLVMVSLPIITLFIVYAGFKFVAAQGRDEALAQAKMNLMYVVIGSILILGAWVIATLIGGTVSQVVGT